MPPGGLLLHPDLAEIFEGMPAMDEAEGRILHASLLSVCCPWVPLPLLDGSWEMASDLCKAGGHGVGSPKAFPSPIPSRLSLGLGAGKGRSIPGRWH